MGTERWAELPDVPTFREQGFDIVMTSERGLAAPRGLPKDVLDRIAGAIQDMLKDPEFQAKAKQQSLPLAYLPGDKWGEKMKTDRKVLEEVWATSPWTKQAR
jgi:tripartite-type tricarboxylate transporter receptor subunit TctC